MRVTELSFVLTYPNYYIGLSIRTYHYPNIYQFVILLNKSRTSTVPSRRDLGTFRL